MTYYRRGSTDTWEELAAVAVGVAAGAAAAYLARLWLRREPVDGPERGALTERATDEGRRGR